MRRIFSGTLWTLALASVLAMHACSDVGDSSAVTNSASGDHANPGASDEDASSDDAPEQSDAPSEAFDAGEEASSVVPPSGEAGPIATGDEDANPDDTGTADVSVVDAGIDATVGVDSGVVDAGGLIDTGVIGFDATVGIDAGGQVDAGVDAGHVTNALAPCTTAGQTNCVLCQYNNGASGTKPNATELCTPTEAALVQHDIASGQATAAGPDPDASCYACAALSGCLDDSEFNDDGHECEDLSGSSNAAECEATLACILGSSCGYASGVISACYCGTAPVSGTCAAAGASNTANGACKTAEATGLGFSATDGLDILKNFTSTTLPSGVANNIFQCAASNNCTTCLH